ncbi:type VI secretion system baseplate subunit TssE [Sedimentisphaera salicampi]|uniref:type VI secretion system baseplate subunit TssE n=1 Tax=Sedimentisphaera salicampi TaxID=1941349 RepID=UPI00137476C3|nr:GPW/gp25 family protein [Sedimentisphaera salicampi]
MSSYRRCVISDIQDLLNSCCRSDDMKGAIKKSVLNYGIDSCVGLINSRESTGYVLESVRQALIDFEPRLVPGSVEVKPVKFDEPDSLREVLLEISAKLKMPDGYEFVNLKARVELETGKYQVQKGMS